MKPLEPLKFNPIFKYRIWGGERLKSQLNKSYTEDQIGESWELSAVPGNVSVVSEGSFKGTNLSELIECYQEDLLGETVMKRFGVEFPILIKFIDAAKDLSIQVHPSDELAQERHQSFGKNEMWHVMHADNNARLIVGFKEGVTKESYRDALNREELESLVNYHKVSEGDTFMIPTGTIHAIGAGTLLAEIQQTSDITYRVYDFNRKDKDGNTRELHTELALEALNYKGVDGFKQAYSRAVNKPNELVHSPYFKTDYLSIDGEFKMDLKSRDSFTILMNVKGKTQLKLGDKNFELSYGETILIPACISEVSIKGAANLLEVYL